MIRNLTEPPRSASESFFELNAEQQAAVKRTAGPVLIVAGAGTGKTRVLAHRIVHLLQEIPGLTPDKILAMTFSRRAADEMRQRVEELLGVYADELQISTFHAFCHQVLTDHAVAAGLSRRVRLLDRAEQYIVLRKLLPTLDLEHHAWRSDPSDCVHGFLRFIGRAKDECVTPDDYAAYLREISDPAAQARAQEVERVYRAYQQRLQEMGALDFGDLVSETLELFRKRPDILQEYQNRFEQILVDEFQDTNVAQILLLSQLAAKHGNLCVVGDDDQAIYRFRGASYASFLLFKERFPQVEQIRLTRNYRCPPAVLGVAEQLIQVNGPDRYDPDKQLWTDRREEAPVELMVCEDDAHQAEAVAQRILRLGPDQRIAVLYRSHSHREAILKALHQHGIPTSVSAGNSLLEEDVVRDLIACLKVAQDPSDAISLFRILCLPVFGIPFSDVVAAMRSAKSQRRGVYEILKSPKAVAWSPTGRRRIKLFRDFLQDLQKTVLRQGIEEANLKILEQLGYRPRMAKTDDPQVRTELLALGQWHRFVRDYVQNHPQQRGLSEFLEYLSAYEEAGGESLQDSGPERTDAVQLMTVHQAKGLEFDWVFLVNLTQGRFPARNRPEPIPFPPELLKEQTPRGDFYLQEERRLCYVAMTRARRGLVISAIDRPRLRPSVFIQDMSGQGEASPHIDRSTPPRTAPAEATQQIAVDPKWEILPEELQAMRLLQELKLLSPDDVESIRIRIEKLNQLAQDLTGKYLQAPVKSIVAGPDTKLSFSQLEMYRYCPRKYQYAYVYSIPTRPTPQMQMGTNIHACLEAFAHRLMAGDPPTLEKLLELYELTWHSEGYPDSQWEAKDKERGRQMVIQFFEANRGQFKVPLYVEKPFLIRIGPARLQGFIDRIDPEPDGRVEVVDYKTGKPKTEAEVGDRMQLNIYALACRQVLGVTPSHLSFYYLQTNEKLTFPYDEAAVNEVAQTISGLAEEIRAEHFDPTPDYIKCRMCDFKTICPASKA